MGLSWQQGPLGHGTVGRFLTATPLPERLPFAEPLRRRMRVRLADAWLADSENVVLLHEPGRYPVAYFPLGDVTADALVDEGRTTQHPDLGDTAWFAVRAGDRVVPRAAWHHPALPAHADVLRDRVAFAWRAMDAFYEEDERVLGHAADPYHRIDIRRSSRHLVVRHGDTVVADTIRPQVLYESGFAPRWYVPRVDVADDALTASDTQTFCPYKGVADYYHVGNRPDAVWTYPATVDEVARIRGLLSFEPDKVDVRIDGVPLLAAPGQAVVSHGVDRGLDLAEVGMR